MHTNSGSCDRLSSNVETQDKPRIQWACRRTIKVPHLQDVRVRPRNAKTGMVSLILALDGDSALNSVMLRNTHNVRMTSCSAMILLVFIEIELRIYWRRSMNGAML